MPISFKRKSFRNELFWNIFTKYFMLILIPAMLASVFTNLFVARLIEDEAEQSSLIVMKNYAKQTDAEFHALQKNMINLLGSPNLRSMLRGSQPVPAEQIETVYALMAQVNSVITEPLVSGAFLYFAGSDLVIDNNIYTNRSFYFRNQYVLEETESARLLSEFSGKRMMFFTEPYRARPNKEASGGSAAESQSTDVSVIMSYPFNSDKPDVYLAVQFSSDKLQRLIRTQENWISRTAIATSGGGVVSQSDTARLNMNALAEALRSKPEGSLAPYEGGHAVSFVRSEFDPGWYYVNWIDLETLMKPARLLRMFSAGFLAFFLLVGAFVSYYFSRRLYTPILEIRNRLQSHQSQLALDGEAGGGTDNDFDVIKRFSKLLISEHKELSQLVKGMLPMVQEDFVTRILLGEYRDNLAIEYYSKEIAFSCPVEGERTVLAVEYHFYGHTLEHLSETSKSFLLVELKEKIWKTVSGTVWLCQTRADILSCVVHHDEETDLADIAGKIKAVLEQYASYFKATIGVGKTVPDVSELHASYQFALAMLKQKSLSAGVEIYSDDDAWIERGPFDSFLAPEEVNRIANLYKTRDYERLLQSALQLLEAGVRKQASAVQITSLCADVLNTWIRVIAAERNDFSFSLYSGLFESLSRCQTWDELQTCLAVVHAQLFQAPSPASRRDQFADVVSYIHEHYHEDLSADWLAAKMNMSVSHFSRTFKEVVGEKYVEYLTKYRLSVAKSLLLDTDMKIEEIAERVGYLGSNAFIRIFRKYEGITPGKYRASR